jgi:hypothetical protein
MSSLHLLLELGAESAPLLAVELDVALRGCGRLTVPASFVLRASLPTPEVGDRHLDLSSSDTQDLLVVAHVAADVLLLPTVRGFA